MTKNNSHINNGPVLNRELDEMVSGSKIDWGKTKEEIWAEMLLKIESPKPHQPKVVYMQFKKLAVAALLVISIGIAAAVFLTTKTIVSPSDQQIAYFLPDSSKVTIKPQTELTFKPLLWKYVRKVKFEGEALFEVEKGNKFEVVSANAKTVVLGTSFNIYARENNYNVTCFSGKVKVVEAQYRNNVLLTPGQKAILTPDGKFETQNIELQQLETIKEPRNTIIDEKLNEVLSAPVQQTIPSDAGQSQVQQQGTTLIIGQNPAKEPDLPALKDEIKDQARYQQPSVESLKNQAQTISEEKENINTDNQEQNTTSGQTADNKQIRDKFRNSLTPEQISILENQQMNRDERKKAFMESLSAEQIELLREQNQVRAGQTKNLQGSAEAGDNVKNQQKMLNRQQAGKGNGRDINLERQKQQNTDKKDNSGQEQHKGQGSNKN